MTLPHRRPVPRLTAKPLALATAFLVFQATASARSAAPFGNLTAEPSWCAPVLSRVAEAAVFLGYGVDPSARELAGNRGGSALRATCSAEHVSIELAEAGSVVTVDATPSGLEVVGEYAAVGVVSRTAFVENLAVETGSLTFAAETSNMSAFVEFEPNGDVVTEGGDATVLNDRFTAVLAGSAAWKDAHVLTFALAGTWSGDDEQQATLDLALAVAVPNPRASGVKKSMVGMVMACGKSAVVCTLAATWLPPIAGACVGESAGCALAIGCALVSCLD